MTLQFSQHQQQATFNRANWHAKGGVAVILALVLMLLAVPNSASAASMGAGFHGNPIPGLQLPHLGNWITTDGHRAYCIEPGRNNPVDAQHQPQLTTTFPAYSAKSLDIQLSISALSGVKLAQINYLVDRWGDTSNNAQAAAVQMAIWILRGTPENYLQKFYSVTAFSGTPSYQTTKNRAQGYVNTAIQEVTAAATGTPALTFNFADALPNSGSSNSHPGELVFTGTGWSGQVGLTEGTFSSGPGSGGSSVAVNQPVTHNVLATRNLTVGQTSDIDIVANGSVSGFPAQGYLHASVTSNQQRLFSAAPKVTREVSATFKADRALFAPVVTTAVTSKYVSPGDQLEDSVTFGVEQPFTTSEVHSSVVSQSWLLDSAGKPLPITARAELYYLPRQIGQGTAPSDAEKVYSTTFTTHPDQDMTEPYVISADHLAEKAGTYSWVIEIHASDQADWVRPYLPKDYYFGHDYGIPEETHQLPFQLGISTVVSAAITSADSGSEELPHPDSMLEMGFGASMVDEVTVTLDHGPWIQDINGDPLPVALTGRTYFVEERPAPSSIAPPGADLIDEISLTVTELGTFNSPELMTPSRAGYITFQWCIDPGQSHVNAGYCDQWGLPNETVQIVAPSFHTQATTSAYPGERITDELFVTGRYPSDPLFVTFKTYLVPKTIELNPEVDTEVDTEVDDAELTRNVDLCIAENLYVETEPFELSTDKNKFTSPEVTVPDSVKPMQIFWIEEVTDSSGNIVHLGECGIENETTQILMRPAPPTPSPKVNDPVLADSGVGIPTKPLIAGGLGMLLLGVAAIGFAQLGKSVRKQKP